MIRQTSLLLLLACTSVALAQPLYKWVEADGSITFSPNRPDAGTPFETIEPVNRPSPAVEPAQPTIPKSVAATPDIKLGFGATDNALTHSAGGSPPISTSRSSIEASVQTARSSDNQELLPASETAEQAANSGRLASIAASNKQSRCQDLRKRVVSLERRLKSRLTPEDMDNTVIHMARYQRSFDQHCE